MLGIFETQGLKAHLVIYFLSLLYYPGGSQPSAGRADAGEACLLPLILPGIHVSQEELAGNFSKKCFLSENDALLKVKLCVETYWVQLNICGEGVAHPGWSCW